MGLKVIIWRDEAGWFIAECPALPGCVSQGRTQDEAFTHIQEAMRGWLEIAHERGLAGWHAAEGRR